MTFIFIPAKQQQIFRQKAGKFTGRQAKRAAQRQAESATRDKAGDERWNNLAKVTVLERLIYGADELQGMSCS